MDWDEKIQIASTNHQAWGAGLAANARFVHAELCETSDPLKFKHSYEKYIQLIGEILRERNIHLSKGLWKHKYNLTNINKTTIIDSRFRYI